MFRTAIALCTTAAISIDEASGSAPWYMQTVNGYAMSLQDTIRKLQQDFKCVEKNPWFHEDDKYTKKKQFQANCLILANLGKLKGLKGGLQKVESHDKSELDSLKRDLETLIK